MLNNYRTTSLGELIAAAFDRAGLATEDPNELNRLAVQSVSRSLRSALPISLSSSAGDGSSRPALRPSSAW